MYSYFNRRHYLILQSYLDSKFNKFKIRNVKSYPRYCKDNPDDILCCMKTITTLGNGTEASNKDCNVLTSEECLKFYNDDIAKTVLEYINYKNYKSLFQLLKDSDPSQYTTDSDNNLCSFVTHSDGLSNLYDLYLDSIDNDTYEKYFNEMKENIRKLESQFTTKERISQNKNNHDTSDSKYLKPINVTYDMILRLVN
ncbi:hypothetical protein PIROE2DRAFT_12705 [Piromyces sp. E2]|nr:hypothetical protein PIROE2DRAFT_12705 [Piromyces sp. E2]|eukprot:OUM61322.1 hypothetical protein PIROE2DRAFT_12705 [Piromyces sp. E2]